MTVAGFESFLMTVAADTAAVISSPEYIAVFGGTLSPRRSRAKPCSQRDAFVRWVATNRSDLHQALLLPESYDDWNDFATYDDLLYFEKDLSYLTSAILVFLESPGSIAELGAFSQIDSLSQRLIIVVENRHYVAKSFIRLGPIRSVVDTQHHPASLCVIPDLAKPDDLTPHIPLAIVETLDEKRKLAAARFSFKKELEQHQILLVLDLINLFLVTTATELKELAGHFGVTLNNKRLEQLTFVLKKTDLISDLKYGGTLYFYPKKFRKPYIDYTSADKTIDPAVMYLNNSTSPPDWEDGNDRHENAVARCAA
jgi:hypothetical protein